MDDHSLPEQVFYYVTSPAKDACFTQLDYGSFLLSIVSVLLTFFGIVVAIGGLAGYGWIKKYAKDISTEIAKEVAERVANQHMQNEMPNIISEYEKLFKNMVESKEADKIASAQEENEDGDNA